MSRISLEKEPEIGLQMAPMINVMLVVLAAFVATAGIIQSEKWLHVSNPQPGTGIFTEPVQIEINRTGQIIFNQAAFTGEPSEQIEGLRHRLQRVIKLLPEHAVIIRPHSDTRHQQVVQVVEVCRSAGVKKLTFGESY